MCGYLKNHGQNISLYTGPLNKKVKEGRSQDWMEGGISVMAATNGTVLSAQTTLHLIQYLLAFGLGINKSNVDFVIHIDVGDGYLPQITANKYHRYL
jgi:superfamily II DNA helicase RecQ